MIELFDETLRELVRREVLNGSQVEIAFDAPTKEWAARRNAPAINVYLYDIRDDIGRREVAFEDLRDPTGRITERRPPVHRFRLSYIVTAWTQRPEDEHRLLSGCLAAFLRHEALAPRELTGALAEQSFPVELSVALPPTEDRSIADVWSALGGELKPSIDLVATVPFVVDRHIEAAPPVLEAPRITLAAPGGAASGPGAGLTAGATGAGGASAGRAGRRGARGADGASGVAPGGDAPVEPPSVTEETVTAGTPDQPGRVVRIRSVRRP